MLFRSNAKNCRVCHHESLEKCSNCHTLEGDEKGGNVKLANAFHEVTSTHSCVGCHETQKKKEECAVCHGSMVKGPSDSSCDTCHIGPLSPDMKEVMLADNMTPVRMVREPDSVIPASTLLEDVPETFDIDVIQDELDPVEFPHTEIIYKMNNVIGNDKLANVFHGDDPVVCAACHHHSPLGEKPPTCAKCHADPFDPREPNKPGIRAAFHIQCIECHRDMQDMEGIELPDYRDCAGCHKDEDAALPAMLDTFQEVEKEASGHE